MTTEQLWYDKTSIASIFAYSQKLIGHSLRELVSEEEQYASNLQGQGKGGLGQMIEALFFHYPINSDPGPDLREAGMDLKATGLKRLITGELQIKERLVCDMIDYEKVVNETFETSIFFIKCHIMLLIFYLYEKGVSKWDLRYIFTVIWKLPENVLSRNTSLLTRLLNLRLLKMQMTFISVINARTVRKTFFISRE